MKKLRFSIALLFCVWFLGESNAQFDTLEMKVMQSKGVAFGVTDVDLIDELMVTMPGLGSNSRDMFTEQSLKAYMMPPRKVAGKGSANSYAIASCLEFYTNFNRNYKVNLSPDFIELNLNQGDYTIREAFNFLSVTGTVSAAIMPFESPIIPAGVYATQKYKIANYLHIIRPGMRPMQKLFEAKKALMRGNPVLFEMEIPEGFSELSGTKTWTPDEFETQNTHPFLIVGFDQEKKAFEILSSWGSDWGKNGYLWISYDDFTKYSKNGFVMIPEKI